MCVFLFSPLKKTINYKYKAVLSYTYPTPSLSLSLSKTGVVSFFSFLPLIKSLIFLWLMGAFALLYQNFNPRRPSCLTRRQTLPVDNYHHHRISHFLPLLCFVGFLITARVIVKQCFLERKYPTLPK